MDIKEYGSGSKVIVTDGDYIREYRTGERLLRANASKNSRQYLKKMLRILKPF